MLPAAWPDAVTTQISRWNGESRWASNAYGTGNAAAAVAEAVREVLAS